MPTFEALLRSIRSEVPEISAVEVKDRLTQDPALIVIDVREPDETREGKIPGAILIPRGLLELKIEGLVPDKSTPMILHCAGGVRSLLAAHSLQQLGYKNVASMAGGFKAWKEGGGSLDLSTLFSDEERIRYKRHLAIPEVREEGQRKLTQAKVLLIGAGGLGCPAAFYLAAAGVGTLGIVDFDTVDATNLQRQILHTTDRIGKLKTDSARQTLLALNPLITVNTYPEKLTLANAEKIFKSYDIVLDGSDNFETRYLINDTCVQLRKPLVHGSVLRFEGQATVFYPGKGPCYRCLYPEPPPPEESCSCAEAGVLGVVPGIIGLMQAVETIKLVLGKGDSLVGRLLCYDALKAGFSEIKIPRDPECQCHIL